MVSTAHGQVSWSKAPIRPSSSLRPIVASQRHVDDIILRPCADRVNAARRMEAIDMDTHAALPQRDREFA